MLTALATLPFLLALTFAAWSVAQLLRNNSDKIIAALKGESLLAKPVIVTRPATVRMNARPALVVRQPVQQWRVAA